MTWAYVRTSTGVQDGKGQVNMLNEYAAKHGIRIDKRVQETISSRKKRSEREVSSLVRRLEPGDTVLVTELSRLARSMTELMAIVQEIREAGAKIVVVSDGMEIAAQDDWKASAYLMAISMGAEIERAMVSQRTKAALKARKEQGVQLGRPKGSSKLRERDSEIEELMSLGVTKANIARILQVSRSTLYDYLATREEAPKR